MALSQIKAIGLMEPPITKKQIQTLTGKLVALNGSSPDIQIVFDHSSQC